MLKYLSVALVFAATLAFVGSLSAQEAKKERPKRGPREMQGSPVEHLSKAFEKLSLTEDQLAKFGKLKEEYGPKVKEAREGMQKVMASLTDEQKKARNEAMKAAHEAGKKGPEAMKAGLDAMKLTDEQKKSLEAPSALAKEFYEKAMELLTPEQKEQLKKSWGGPGKREGRPGKPKPKPEA